MKRIILLLLLPGIVIGAERVVSLSPAVTELIIYIGAAEQLCGRSSACEISAVRQLPVCGDLGLPFVEAIIKNRASAVISDIRHPRARWDLLSRCRIKVALLDNRRLADLPVNAAKIGKLLNLPGAGCKAEKLRAALQKLRADRPSAVRKGVVLLGVAPLVSCGQDNFISEAVGVAGVENIAALPGGGYFTVTPEFLLASAPEYILSIGIPEELVRREFKRKIYRDIPAVRNNRIIFLSAENWGRLSPAIIPAVASLQQELR